MPTSQQLEEAVTVEKADASARDCQSTNQTRWYQMSKAEQSKE